MSAHVFNAEEFKHPADGWYQIEAKGDHPNRAAGVVQVIDNESAQSIVNRFNADAAAGTLRHGSDMLIDHEHFSDQPDQETRAYGWLTQLQNRNDGIYGQIRWSKIGQEAVDGGEYRFFSTEYSPADCKVLNGGDPKRIRPLKLAGLTLTNMNNNRGQKPITNRAADTTTPHQSEAEKGFPVPALEEWFMAVSAMFKRLNDVDPNSRISWQKAWDLCRKQHPDMYAEAFGAENDSESSDAAGQDETAAKQDSAALMNVTNRVKQLSGYTFQRAWDFARREMPAIHNRAARSSARIVNRQPLNLRANAPVRNEEDKARSGRIFNRALQLQGKGMKWDRAWNTARQQIEAAGI